MVTRQSSWWTLDSSFYFCYRDESNVVAISDGRFSRACLSFLGNARATLFRRGTHYDTFATSGTATTICNNHHDDTQSRLAHIQWQWRTATVRGRQNSSQSTQTKGVPRTTRQQQQRVGISTSR